MSRPHRHPVHLVTKILLCLVVLIIGLRTWTILDDQPNSVKIPVRASEPEHPLPEAPHLVRDGPAGHRPRANYRARFRSAVLGSETEYEVIRRQGRLGLIRPEALADELPAPRILMVGDLELMGVVSAEHNLSHLIETRLRQVPGLATSLVLNAGCAGYGPYQDALRAASLAPLLQPQVLVALISMGNDFLDLEDRRRPHLDVNLLPQPARVDLSTDTNSNRQAMLGLSNPGAFWQGMNQAAWLEMHSERLPQVQEKFLYCLRMLANTARKQGSSLLLVLLPSSDLILPSRITSQGSAYADKIVAAGIQANWYRGICELLSERGYAFEDLRPSFLAHRQPELYAMDHHLSATGHRLLAEAISPRIQQLITSRSRFR